jgi:hypothetical protein
MISTLVTANAASHLSATCVISLVLLLAAHELAEPIDSSTANAFKRNLLAFSIPLLVVFASIVAMAITNVIAV